MNIEAFIEHLSNDESKSPETVKSYKSDLNLFSAFLQKNDVEIDQVDARVMSRYLAYLKIRPNPRFGKTGLAVPLLAAG